MTEKFVIVHRSVIEKWSLRKDPPLPGEQISRALGRIDAVVEENEENNIIFVEESPDTDFKFLPGRVGTDNTARLLGARAGWCLRIARQALEEAGIEVTLDQEGSLS